MTRIVRGAPPSGLEGLNALMSETSAKSVLIRNQDEADVTPPPIPSLCQTDFPGCQWERFAEPTPPHTEPKYWRRRTYVSVVRRMVGCGGSESEHGMRGRRACTGEEGTSAHLMHSCSRMALYGWGQGLCDKGTA